MMVIRGLLVLVWFTCEVHEITVEPEEDIHEDENDHHVLCGSYKDYKTKD